MAINLHSHKLKVFRGSKIVYHGHKLKVIHGNQIVYHGSGASGIERFMPADETTVGEGLYATDNLCSAEGYARSRARARASSYISEIIEKANKKGYNKKPVKAEPTVYTVKIDGKFIDLNDEKTLKTIMTGFGRFLDISDVVDRYLDRFYKQIKNAIIAIDDEKYSVGRINNVTKNGIINCMLTEYLQSRGFDGLVTMEGGEGDFQGNHSTWVIFDPSDIKKLGERILL